MNLKRESTPSVRGEFICEFCGYIYFSSYSEFAQHHLCHIRQPIVSLRRLSDSCVDKANRGVLRVEPASDSTTSEQVSSITLSVVNQSSDLRVLVIKKQSPPSDTTEESSATRASSSSKTSPKAKMDKQSESQLRLGSRESAPSRRRSSSRGNNRSPAAAASTAESNPPIPKIRVREPYVMLERIDREETETSEASPTKKAKPDNNQPSTSSGRAGSQTPTKQKAEEPAKPKASNGNDNQAPEPRKSPRTKTSTRGRKSKKDKAQETAKTDSVAEQKERAETPARRAERRTSVGLDTSDLPANTEDDNLQNMELPPLPSTPSGFPLLLDLSGKQAAERAGPSNPMPSIINLSNGFYLVHTRANDRAINWQAVGGTVIQTWELSSASGLLTLKRK